MASKKKAKAKKKTKKAKSQRAKAKPARKVRAAATRRERPAADGLAFNHAMVYVADVPRALAFYRDQLGFRVVDEYSGAYARLMAPAGGSTIALHTLEPEHELGMASEGLRLYFEVAELEAFCARLQANGVVFTKPPELMPWGWRHAYLKDPDGHEISLYWAGEARLRATRMADGDH